MPGYAESMLRWWVKLCEQAVGAGAVPLVAPRKPSHGFHVPRQHEEKTGISMIGSWTHDEFVEEVRKFHCHVAPGVIIGGYMVEMARRALPQGILFDAVAETVQCLPDAVQLLTPCTVGNGWLRVYHFGIYALTLYDKTNGEGVRVRLDAGNLDRWPNVRAWFFKEKPKREQDSDALHREIREAGFALLQAAPVRIHADSLRHKGKGQVIRCPRCGEWYPAELGPTCRPCQGAGPYENWAGLHGVR